MHGVGDIVHMHWVEWSSYNIGGVMMQHGPFGALYPVMMPFPPQHV